MKLRVIDLLKMIASDKKLPRYVVLLSGAVKDEFRIITLTEGNYYIYSDGGNFNVIAGKLELNDPIYISDEFIGKDGYII